MAPAVWLMAAWTLRQTPTCSFRMEVPSLSRLQVSARPRSAGPPAPAPNGCSHVIGRPSWSTFTLTSAVTFTPATGFQVGYTWHTRENITRVGVNYHFD